MMRIRVSYEADKPEDLQKFIANVKIGHKIIKTKEAGRMTGRYRRVYLDIRPKR
jgi:hypothetical protein